MELLNNVWFLITLAIILIILTVDPKDSVQLSGNTEASGIFSSSTKGQKFINRLNGFLITLFFILTVLISYVS